MCLDLVNFSIAFLEQFGIATYLSVRFFMLKSVSSWLTVSLFETDT